MIIPCNSQFLPLVRPTITSPLVFTPGSSSSTLTCTSTGSVATTVTFMRDNTTVGPLTDGESVTISGVTYQLVQTVTNRRQSSYESVLTITEEWSSLAGSTFTCQVENVLRMSETSQSFEIPGKIYEYILQKVPTVFFHKVISPRIAYPLLPFILYPSRA